MADDTVTCEIKALKVFTETGSVYTLDRSTMTWERMQNPRFEDPQFPLRTIGGKLLEWPDVELNQPMGLVCPPMVAKSDIRLVRTSPVSRIEYTYYGRAS